MLVMKRTFLLLIVLLLIVPDLTAQILGTGTSADPYRGINAGDFTISGTKYFNNNIGVSSGTLTLMPGTRLISKGRYACILISGTGQLNAPGNLIARILITADLDGDNIVGELTDMWGNILMTSSGTSNLNYCTIEVGNRTRYQFLGGALKVSSGTVTINNSIIRNCTASKGGGIYVEAGASLTISNTQFSNNRANENGGAIFMASGSAPVISSSLFRNNTSLSTTLMGGAIAAISASPVIVNSTFAYNDSPAADGTTIYLVNSPAAKVVNTVIWGGSSHIGLSGTPSSVFDICSIEGESFAGCFNLNSNNTAADGPNFVDPAVGDFKLTYASPMRDTGVDSYPGITVPLFDLIGSGRVNVTDRGAYEMIYSRWHGGTDQWSAPGNWDAGAVPYNTVVIIPSGAPTYPTATPGPAFNLITGLFMVLEPGAQATFSSLTNGGTIDIHANATEMASLITGSYSGAAGVVNVDVYLTAATAEIDRWHYIASPTDVSKTVFTSIEPDYLTLYDESKVIDNVVQGWQWHDGYNGTEAFSTLDAKKGYQVLVEQNTTLVFRNLSSITTSMGRIDLPFSGSGGDTSLFGYSLLGNSLTCGLNWDLVVRSDINNLRNGIYWVKDGVDVSYVNGVGTNGGSGHIPPLQGFFVKTRATGTYLTFPDNAREHNTTPRYKSSQQIPLIRLTLISSFSQDETVIRFEPAATMDFDGEYDADKIFSPVIKGAKIFSTMRGEKYSINSMPWPENSTTIPLTVTSPEAGTFKIKRSQLQMIENYKVILTDRLAGKSIDLLTNSEYSFSAPAGTISDRFTLTVSLIEKAAITEDNAGPEPSSLKIYSSSGRVCILPQGSGWDGISGKVRIFDITGRMILASNNERFNSGELLEYYPGDAGGLLIVEVTAGPKRYLEKVVLAK